MRRVNVRDRGPQVARLQVRLQTLGLIALEVGGVQAGLIQAPDFGQQLPRPGDGLALEVVAEGPVAQHFEERVVVGIVPDVVQVVVLAAGADALLRVDRARPAGLLQTQEVGFELVHAGVGEQQRRVLVGHHGAAGHEVMRMPLTEKLDEVLPNLSRCARQFVHPV